MGLYKKKRKESLESRFTRLLRLSLWYLFKKARFRDRMEKANQWAERNKGKTATMTVGSLLLMLVVGTVMTLTNHDNGDEGIVEGIASVNPMFEGLRRIQDNKTYQLSQVEKMAMRGKRLKYELDSLIHSPSKSHDDSLQILIKHRQLELIVNNLEYK